MKQSFILPILLLSGTISFAQENGKNEEKKIVVLQWNREIQQIDGFGVGEADWADELYTFQNRDSVMECRQ